MTGLIDKLPYELTGAQKRAIDEIVADMESPFVMQRLIQGDVGSGKTIVAFLLMAWASQCGYQSAIMAPTEVLANQHYESFCGLVKMFGLESPVILLTGSMTQKQKRAAYERMQNEKNALIIGTHALIQEKADFSNLSLVITDEQHRFGVKQRDTFSHKGIKPHILVMSATPIPRTLGLILYGDLDISVLDELPPGRQTVRTDVVDSRYHKRLYKFIKDAVARGEQCYIVCPAVEENETNIKSAEEFAEELANGEFKGYNLGILHGKMKAKDKEAIMKSFAYGKVSILVATTVVEVGVDVPNATIMVIENAERFGLSTLHQLRGRVGRGNKQSYCVLVSDAKGETSRERLMTMKQFSDGFKIADTDLKLRGPGDFFGSRQHGLPELKIADMVEDMDTLKKAQECAQDILKSDFSLSNSPALKKQMNKMFEKIVN